MVDTKALKEENERWHQEHAMWVEEADHWQHETQRLVALLFLLDRAIPEHSTMLVKHVSLIEQHEQLIKCYECGLDERCFSTCPDFKSSEEHVDIHQKLVDLHAETKQEHQILKQRYTKEMERFRSLARDLLNESYD